MERKLKGHCLLFLVWFGIVLQLIYLDHMKPGNNVFLLKNNTRQMTGPY